MNVLWYMCAPDGAYPWNPQGARTVDYGYFQQLAKAYDRLGFTGALFATGAHDVWVLAAALLLGDAVTPAVVLALVGVAVGLRLINARPVEG